MAHCHYELPRSWPTGHTVQVYHRLLPLPTFTVMAHWPLIPGVSQTPAITDFHGHGPLATHFRCITDSCHYRLSRSWPTSHSFQVYHRLQPLPTFMVMAHWPHSPGVSQTPAITDFHGHGPLATHSRCITDYCH